MTDRPRDGGSGTGSGTDGPVLSVRDLVVEFAGEAGPVRAVDGVSFDVLGDEVLAVVGESGSGKSVTMLAALGLLPSSARIVSGTVEFRGRDITHLPRRERRALMGKEMSMIFQDPMTSLNPVATIGRQIAEMVRQHQRGLSRRAVRTRVVELLEKVRIPDAANRYRSYPFELSGGMRQRAMIAMAVAHDPALLIADEPTTALDVTIQAQVLRMLGDIRDGSRGSMVLITHDLGLVAEFADRVVVLYGGKVMEAGRVRDVYAAPAHPYTVGLLASSLRLDTPVEVAYAIPGQPPRADRRPDGCVFRPRCGLAGDRSSCRDVVPVPEPVAEGHTGACHHHGEVADWATADPELSRLRTIPRPAPSEVRT